MEVYKLPSPKSLFENLKNVFKKIGNLIEKDLKEVCLCKNISRKRPIKLIALS